MHRLLEGITEQMTRRMYTEIDGINFLDPNTTPRNIAPLTANSGFLSDNETALIDTSGASGDGGNQSLEQFLLLDVTDLHPSDPLENQGRTFIIRFHNGIPDTHPTLVTSGQEVQISTSAAPITIRRPLRQPPQVVQQP